MLKYEKEKEKKAFKAMTFKEKMQHIRNYHTGHRRLGAEPFRDQSAQKTIFEYSEYLGENGQSGSRRISGNA